TTNGGRATSSWPKWPACPTLQGFWVVRSNGDLEAGSRRRGRSSGRARRFEPTAPTKAKKKSETSADDEERGLQFRAGVAALTQRRAGARQFAEGPRSGKPAPSLILFVLFWAVWLAMLFALSIIIIVLSPRWPAEADPPVVLAEPSALVRPGPGTAPAVPKPLRQPGGLAGKVDYIRYLGINNFLNWQPALRHCHLDFAAIDTVAGQPRRRSARLTKRRPERKASSFMMEAGRQRSRPGWKLPGAEGGERGGVLLPTPRSSLSRCSRPGRGQPAGGLLHTLSANRTCNSLNTLQRPASRRADLFDAHERLAGRRPVRSFSLTNAAFALMPKKTNMRTPAPGSTPPSGGQFRALRPRLNRTQRRDRRGRELALFVDLGERGLPDPLRQLVQAATFGAQRRCRGAHTGLGRPLLPAHPRQTAALRAGRFDAAAVAAADGAGIRGASGQLRLGAATGLYLRRDSSPALAVLWPELCLAWGWSITDRSSACRTWPAYRLSANLTSYLTGAGQHGPGQQPHAVDRQRRQCRLAARPGRQPQLGWRPLVGMATSLESLQWGARPPHWPNLPRRPRSWSAFNSQGLSGSRPCWCWINNGDQHGGPRPICRRAAAASVKLLYSWGSARPQLLGFLQEVFPQEVFRYRFAATGPTGRSVKVFLLQVSAVSATGFPQEVFLLPEEPCGKKPGGKNLGGKKTRRGFFLRKFLIQIRCSLVRPLSPRYKAMAIQRGPPFDIAFGRQHNPHLQSSSSSGDWGRRASWAVERPGRCSSWSRRPSRVVQLCCPRLPREPASASRLQQQPRPQPLNLAGVRARGPAPPARRWSAPHCRSGHSSTGPGQRAVLLGLGRSWTAGVSAEMQSAGRCPATVWPMRDWPSPELLLGLLLPASSAAAAAAAASGASVGQLGRIIGFGDGVGWFGGRRRSWRCGTPTPARAAVAPLRGQHRAPSQTLCLAAAVSASTRSIGATALVFLRRRQAAQSARARRPPRRRPARAAFPLVSTYSERERSQAMRLLHMTAGLVSPGGGSQQQQQQGGARRNHVIAVYSREIVLIDLLINQPVASIALERSAAGFLRVHSCAHRDLLACLQETGAVSLPPAPARLRRVTRHCGLADVCLDPLLETRLALATTDGRVAFWELTAQPAAAQQGEPPSEPSGIAGVISAAGGTAKEPPRPRAIWGCLAPESAAAAAAAAAESEDVAKEAVEPRTQPAQLKMLMTGLHSGICPAPCAVSILLTLTTAVLSRSCRVLNVPVAGIRWCGQDSLVLHGSDQPNSAG
uniref:Protein kinase domain-containing protein n=1 Tax=Macrostomum lignano TaxID=282301 RepID=A0A1I8FBE9_9PLAT